MSLPELAQRVHRLEQDLGRARRHALASMIVAVGAIAVACKPSEPASLTFGKVRLDSEGLTIDDGVSRTNLGRDGLLMNAAGKMTWIEPGTLSVGHGGDRAADVQVIASKTGAMINLRRDDQQATLSVDADSGSGGTKFPHAGLALAAGHEKAFLDANSDANGGLGYSVLSVNGPDGAKMLSTKSDSPAKP